MSDNRDRGIEFGELQDDLEEQSYPMEKEEILEKYGDRTVEHSHGSASIREIIDTGAPDEFESHEELHETILNLVGEEAVGRKGYSDRGTSEEPSEGQDTI